MPTPVTSRRAGVASSSSGRLLVKGNEKLGADIYNWSIPHGRGATCPGATNVCGKVCYVGRYTRRFLLSYEANLAATRRMDFEGRMVAECEWKRLVRIHVSGDFYSAEYVRKWIAIIRRCPQVRFYAYTRSWRGGDVKLLEALIELSRLPNMVLNISTDRESGIPGWLHGAFGGWGRICYLATDDRDVPRNSAGEIERVNIVFRTKRSTVMGKLGGSTVCPVENGLENSVTCQRCKLCFK